MKNKISTLIISFAIVCAFTFSVAQINIQNAKTAQTSSSALSNTKIGWGIKRVDNHEQPDLGAKNKKIIEQYEGIAMGNKDKKYVYLTFDEGYEAGYTPKILEILKQNEVTACFFITAHFLNTQPDLVKQMIAENHIVRKSHLYSSVHAGYNK